MESTTPPQQASLQASSEEPLRPQSGTEATPPNDEPAKNEILALFGDFVSDTGGIDSWLTSNAPPQVLARLTNLDKEPLSREQLNQLLVLSHEAGMSAGFFAYYWLDAPPSHPHDVKKIDGFDQAWLEAKSIQSLGHLRWGLYRFYVDALRCFGNVRSAYRRLRDMSDDDLAEFFAAERFDHEALKQRGKPLSLHSITKDDRYLISEMACKSFDSKSSDLRSALTGAYQAHVRAGGGPISIGQLLEGEHLSQEYADRQQQFVFAADELLDQEVDDIAVLEGKVHDVAQKFEQARQAALSNTSLYLSMVEELDAYVATSMRTRADFRSMASFCEDVFADARLKEMSVRHFDPTMSAAEGHEDKGLIECLMVKCAKVLVYFAGEKESYGKDAEAAMALSLGKPVIFYCDEKQRGRLYRDIHPLSRLINFTTGVAVGAMVTSSKEEVSELIYRLLSNQMEYKIDQPKEGYLRLRETLTGSVVRLQTNDKLLRETFWNYYHRTSASPLV